MPYLSNARTATHSGAARPQPVSECACALLDFKQLVPKGGQIELNSVVDQNSLATTQICERLREKTASVDFYFLGCGPECVIRIIGRTTPELRCDLAQLVRRSFEINFTPETLTLSSA